MEFEAQLATFEKRATDVLRSRGFLTAVAAGVFWGVTVGLQEAGLPVNADQVNIVLSLFGLNIAKYFAQDWRNAGSTPDIAKG